MDNSNAIRVSRLNSVRVLVALAATIFALLGTSISLQGQVLSGINGTVTDQSGAVVAGASITVTNVDTNVSKKAVATTAGTYYITDLIPGTYTVRVEQSGFRVFVQHNVNVAGGATSTANAVMQPGSVEEQVEVSASAVALQTEQPEIGTTINQTLMSELPQLVAGQGRQIDNFIFLVPGVTGSGFSHRINGGVDEQTEVMFNGVPEAWAETSGFTQWNQPPYDSIKDVNVLTGTFSAQYGLGQGVEQYTAKSGTNQIHGDGFFFNRDSFFDAPGAVVDVFGNNKGEKDKPNTDVETDLGGSAGGPVWIPKLYDGRNKAFWFVSYDRYRKSQGQSPITMPTAAQVQGDFSGLVDPTTGTPIPIFVPLAWGSNSSLIPAGCNLGTLGYTPGQQFPGNKIDPSCFSAASKALLGFVPAPNTTGAGFNHEINNFVPSFTPLNLETFISVNTDYNLTDNQSLHGWYWRHYYPTPSGIEFTSTPIDNSFTNYVLARAVDITYANAISPHFVVTGGFLYAFQSNDFQPTHFYSGQFPGAAPFSGAANILPGINFTGGNWEPDSWGARNGGLPTQNHKTGYSFMGNALWTRSRHTINFGVDIRKTKQLDFECDGCSGNIGFDSSTTADPNDPTGGGVTGNGFASFLLGNADSATRAGAAPTTLTNTYLAPYFQDDMQITRRLKVNWGLRWDLAFPFNNDFHSNQLTFFNPKVPNAGAINPSTGQPLLGGMAQLGKGCPLCIGWSHMDMMWTHLSPRLGFNYQLNNKTVLLAGASWYWLNTGAYEYGVNKVAVAYGNNLNGFEEFDHGSQGSIGNYSNPGYGLWDTTASAGTPTGPLPAPAQLPLTTDFFNTAFPSAMEKHVRQAYDEQFVLGIQRELPWNMFLTVSGVHTHDLHLPSLTGGNGRLNYVNYGFVQSVCPPGLATFTSCVLGQPWTSAASQTLMASQASQFGFSQYTYPASDPSCPGMTLWVPYINFCDDYSPGGLTARAFLKYPQFRGITNNFDTNGADKYNALQMSLQKRTGSGLTFLVSYTLSRYFSNTDSGFSTFNFRGLDPNNQKRDWSVGNDDRTHVISIAGVYELPIGRGRKLLNNANRIVNNAIGGWNVRFVNYYESGTPVQFTSCGGVFNCTPLLYTAGYNRPNISSTNFNVNWHNYYNNLNGGSTPIFNTSIFSFPGAWTIGNAAELYNNFRNAWYNEEDISVGKKFFVNERVNFEFSVEFFNVLNRMNIGNCIGTDNGTGSSNFGTNVPGNPCQAFNNAGTVGPRVGQIKLQLNF
jgi:hypothetical protein